LAAKGVKLITLTTHDLLIHSNFQDFERYQPVDLAISGDAEASMPYLVEAVRRAVPASAQAALKARGDKLAAAHADTRAKALQDAAYGWDATPISLARLCAELWPLIKDSDWAFVGANSSFQSFWPQRLWDFDKPYRYAGGPGGSGVGYGAPAAVGAALAHREHGRLVVNIQGDGDLMCAPGSLWTAVHHKIPLLTVMHNNRAYHQEMMHIQRMAGRRARGVDRAHIGTAIDNPFIDYSKLASSMGMWATGPVTDPNELSAALKKAVEVVKRGEPALVDVVCQPR
jgi:acetolactate synthase-1/2/3 large subunit